MRRAQSPAAYVALAPRYLLDLLGSGWFFVCLGGTIFGLASPFLPPLKSALPVSVGLAIAIGCWTLAPLRLYYQQRQRIQELEAHRDVGANVTVSTVGSTTVRDVTVNASNSVVVIASSMEERTISQYKVGADQTAMPQEVAEMIEKALQVVEEADSDGDAETIDAP